MPSACAMRHYPKRGCGRTSRHRGFELAPQCLRTLYLLQSLHFQRICPTLACTTPGTRAAGRARGAYSPRRRCKYGIALSLVFGVLWSLSLLLYIACRVKCCWWGCGRCCCCRTHGHTAYSTSHSQLAEPLLQLSGRVLRHGGVAATNVLAVDPNTWDSALPRHVGQKALHVMAISSLVELNYSWTHGQADKELLCLRAEAAPDPCMACTWHATLHGCTRVRPCTWHRYHVLLKMTTGFSAMTWLGCKVAVMVSSPSPSLNPNMISFCKAERSSGVCGSLESTEPIVLRRDVPAAARAKTKTSERPRSTHREVIR